MRRPRVHVLAETGVDMRPHGSAYLRLIRPLSHPGLKQAAHITFGFEAASVAADIVLIDRLWKPARINVQETRALVQEIRQQGAKLVYCFDDDFLGMEPSNVKYPAGFKDCVEIFLEASDALILTTLELKNRYQTFQPAIFTVPSCLDEMLIIRKYSRTKHPDEKVILGYMGTATHDDDLELALPAIRQVCAENPGRIQIEVVGAVSERDIQQREVFQGLPVRILQPRTHEVQYPLFMLWFTGTVRWDIGIAPLVDNPFNHCKSDIKFLDYAAAGVPGVFSALPAYKDTVQNRENGLIVQNDPGDWYNALSELVKFPALRTHLSERAESYLYQERILSKGIQTWADLLRRLAEG